MENRDFPQHPWATFGMGRGGAYRWFDDESKPGGAWGRHLPHWRQSGAIYFVTFRTADSLPADTLAEWKIERSTWLAAHPPPHDERDQREYHRRFTERMQRLLDRCHGTCPMRKPAARQIVVESLRKLDGAEDGYALDAFVIMPNHVHVLVSPSGEVELSEIGKVWKRVTSHRLNALFGRKGAFWQHESWDHIVRSLAHLEKFRQYIRENPSRLPRVRD